MRKLLHLAVIAGTLAASGCTGYASSRLMRAEAPAPAPQVFGVIEGREFAKRVQVKLPADLVVSEVRSDVGYGREDPADKRGVQLTDALAQDKATYADVSPLFEGGQDGKFDDLRAAASRHHADLLLVTSMTERVADETGILSVLKILILPCFLVPTETNDLKLHVRAAVVDVRNDLVYAAFEDHREERVHATSAGEKDSIEAGFDRLYADSLAKLRTRIAERLRTLEAGTN